jgi:hypothetical protein
MHSLKYDKINLKHPTELGLSNHCNSELMIGVFVRYFLDI